MRHASIRQHQEAERLEARISADKKNILRNAAELSGRTLTDFVVHSAYEAAVRVIQEYQQLHLTTIDRNIFIQALFTPPKATNSLLNAVERYKKNVALK